MQQQSYLLIVISTIVLFYSVFCQTDPELACIQKSNIDCNTCLAVPNCAFCSDSLKCYLYSDNILNPPCNVSKIQWQTCVVSFRVWIVVVAVLGAVVALAVLIFVCCLCSKCKKCRNRRIDRSQERDARQMEERRAAAEARTAERSRVADEIRMKYGVLKEKDAVTDYTRMS